MKNLKLFLSILFIGMCGVVFSQNTFKTQKIAVFKNGTGFFIKSGKIDAPNGNYILKQTPLALFGTLWVSANGEQIKSLHTLQDKSVEKKDAEKIGDLLIGNEGKKAKIILYSGSEYDAIIGKVQKKIVTFQAKDKWITTEISSVRTIEFYQNPNLSYNYKTDANQLSVEFDAGGKKSLNLMYLQKGIGWFPCYLVEINDNNKAIVTLKSTLLNDVEDIENTELSFVVGVPSFKYNFIESPLTSGVSLSSFISGLNNGTYRSVSSFDNSNVMSNAIMTQTVGYANSEANVNDGYFNDKTEFSSDFKNQEDLYFYKQKNVTLKKGDRITFDLLKTNVDFEHVYEATLQPNGTSYYNVSKTYSEPSANKVWHSIKLKNSSKMPWTTGTAMIMKVDKDGEKPISQDMMKYTPVGSETFLKITISPDITIKDRDKEIKREEKSKRKNNDYYDLVTVQGSIVVKNYKSNDIKLNIKRNIYGKLLTSNIDWKFTKIPYTYNSDINSLNNVTWDVSLKPGEEKEIQYTYTIYVHH